MNWFDFALKLKGFPIERAKEQLRIIKIELQNNPNFSEERKLEIVKFHIENNPFYQKKVKEFTSWKDLPVLTKKDLQQPLENRLSIEYKKENIYINKTSGSSGDPFIFAIDKKCHALTWANTIALFNAYNINFNKDLQARFYGIPLDFIGNKKERIKDFLSQRFRFNIFQLNEKVFENYLKKFSIKKFKYINGYTSSIVLFAKFLKSKNIVLKDICPTLEVCFVTSEMLIESDKVLLESQFNTAIVNEYGASETGIIAFENHKKEWLINQETLFVEVVDDNNQPVSYGQEGKILVTSLYNYAHPFIRYEIGDRGIINLKGNQLILEKLTGRTNDFAILSNGHQVPGLTFYYVTKSIINDDGLVKEFVVKQTAIDTFEIHYVSELTIDDKKKMAIYQAMKQYVSDDLKVEIIKKKDIKRTKSGKLKQFEKLNF
jgi:phenylacetate-CoA ligase